MKSVFNRSELVAAVSTVQRAVSSKSQNPALEGILIKAHGSTVSLCGYDLELGITTEIPASIIEEGDIVFSAKLFSEIVRYLPDEIVTIETNDKFIAYINSGEADYQIVGISSYEYPELPSFQTLQTFEIEAGTLKSMIKDTFYAISDNPAKPNLTGMFFDVDVDSLTIVGVDGFRMSVRKEAVNSGNKFDFLVPKKTVGELVKINCEDSSPVKVILGEKQVIFEIEDYSIISRLIEAKFVNYKPTLSQGFKTSMTMKTKDIISSVERMSLITSEKMQQPVHFLIADNKMKIFCTTTIGKASDVINIQYEGEDVEIGFNNRYMLDAVKNVDADEIILQFNGSMNPLKIFPTEGDRFVVIIVPMRI